MTTHDFRPLRDRLETEFAEMLGPDLKANGASRIYIVLLGETGLFASGTFLGLTGPRIGEWLHPFIPRWSGPGPAMLVDDAAIARDFESNPAYAEDRFTGVAVHELGHIACTDNLYAHHHENSARTASVLQETFTSAVASSTTFDPSTASQRPDHGTDWLRACCHITHRMQKRGWPVFLPMVINTDFFGISSTSVYSRALGDECVRLEHLPITDILLYDAPNEFLYLWKSDLARWPNG